MSALTNTLHCVDNLALFSMMRRARVGFDLCYADMLFDAKSDLDLIWLEDLRTVANDTASVYVHTDQRSVCEVKAFAEKVGWKLRSWIIWSYNWGGRSRNLWGAKHDDILLFTKGDSWTFNAAAVQIPKRVLINSKKTHQIPTDVWDLQVVHTMSKEKAAGEHRRWQKPRSLLHRIIAASSNAGDLVLDPFCGTGTTCVEAAAQGRNYIACDTDAECIRITERRLRSGI